MLLYLFNGKFSQRVGGPELYFVAVRAVTTGILEIVAAIKFRQVFRGNGQ